MREETATTMRIFRPGDQVYIRASPHNAGTVSRTDDAGFQVTYQVPRKKGQPRSRFSYPWTAAHVLLALGPRPGDPE